MIFVKKKKEAEIEKEEKRVDAETFLKESATQPNLNLQRLARMKIMGGNISAKSVATKNDRFIASLVTAAGFPSQTLPVHSSKVKKKESHSRVWTSSA